MPDTVSVPPPLPETVSEITALRALRFASDGANGDWISAKLELSPSELDAAFLWATYQAAVAVFGADNSSIRQEALLSEHRETVVRWILQMEERYSINAYCEAHISENPEDEKKKSTDQGEMIE